MSHKKKKIEADLEKEIKSMDKLLEKDDYSVLKNSMVDETSSLEAQRDGWKTMWKGVGDELDKCMEKM